MRTSLLNKIYLILLFIPCSIIYYQYRKQLRPNGGTSASTTSTILPVVQSEPSLFLWWTPFMGDDFTYENQCATKKCHFTENRHLLHDPNLKAILFYGSNFNFTDIPMPRRPTVPWILFHEESPKNQPVFSYASAISVFNATATFSRYSNFPLTLQYLTDANALLDHSYFQTVSRKNELQQDDQLASVVYVQSICNTMSGRDEYVQELMKFINIDSYGLCLNNKPMPFNLTGPDYLSTIFTEEFYHFIGRYKFVIAYENSICNDYITEKLWRPLTIGVVPIYFGAPNVRDWLPNPKSAILIGDFESPRHLAEHLMYLNEEDAEYNGYLDHKLKPSDNETITNVRLLQSLADRSYDRETIVHDFECYFCEHDGVSSSSEINQPNQLHYDCAMAATITARFADEVDESSAGPIGPNAWKYMLKQGQCEADVFAMFVEQNRSFTNHEYFGEMNRRYEEGICAI